MVSLSIGDTARFRFGTRKPQTAYTDVELRSGDLFRLRWPVPFAYHGVPRCCRGPPTRRAAWSPAAST